VRPDGGHNQQPHPSTTKQAPTRGGRWHSLAEVEALSRQLAGYLDVEEIADAYLVEIELPGIGKDDSTSKSPGDACRSAVNAKTSNATGCSGDANAPSEPSAMQSPCGAALRLGA